MTNPDDPEHRAYHHVTPDRVSVREDSDDDTFVVRMPIASTGEVRNEGDDPLSFDELAGMATQVERGDAGVFLDHGMSDLGGWRYSATGKIGEWANPEMTDADEERLLMADARLMDPDTMSEATGNVREALAVLKAQAERGIGLSSSIGWRDDDESPGGVDLMEASIVGIPADPRTTTQSAVADVARAAVDGRDDLDAGGRAALVDQFRDVVMGPDADDEGQAARDSVTDTDSNESGSDPDGTNDAGDDVSDAEEFRSEMLEMQRQQTEVLSTVADALREDGDGEDDEEEEEDDEDDEGDDGGQNAADPGPGDADGDGRDASPDNTLTVDDEEMTADDVRDLRSQLENADPDVSGDGVDDGDDTEQRENQPADPQDLL